MKLPHRRQFLHLAAGAAALPAVSRVAWAQAYPTRRRMAAMATSGSNATTRHVCSNVRFRGQKRTRYVHIEFFAL